MDIRMRRTLAVHLPSRRRTGAASTRLFAQDVHGGAGGPGCIIKLADAAKHLSVQLHGDLLVLDHAHLHGRHLHVPENVR